MFDDKAKAFMLPFFVANENLARRSFGDAVSDPSTGLSKHAVDYKLYSLGFWDDNTGIFTAHARPEFLAMALDFISVKKEGVDEKDRS